MVLEQSEMRGVLQDWEKQVKEAEAQLAGTYGEGARVLAEFCGVCVERLQMLGKSLYCRARYQRSEGGFNWPPLPLEKAQLLRQQVHPLAPQQVTISSGQT
jgi:hypothetical protein